MPHENLERQQDVASSSDRIFGLVFSALFFLVGFLPMLYGYSIQIWSLVLSGLFLVVSVVRPKTLSFLNHWWTRFGLLLHTIVSPITLATLFFGVIMPIGIIMRLFGHDPLRLQFDNDAKSYWIDRKTTKESESSSMINQF